jgi:hypothetical protein
MSQFFDTIPLHHSKEYLLKERFSEKQPCSNYTSLNHPIGVILTNVLPKTINTEFPLM